MNFPDKWTTRFLDLAYLVSDWSKDSSTKVGAVITDDRNRVISLGFNGFPRLTRDLELSRDRKLLRTVHAELNAILFSETPLDGTTMYVTHHPCAACAAVIVQAGIDTVVIPQQDVYFSQRWEDHLNEARAMFEEAGVDLIEVLHGRNIPDA